LYSISGHKFSAPKGVGALYVREGVKLAARQFGGRHERERRAGTENVPGIAALGAAAQWLVENGAVERDRLTRLRDLLEHTLVSRVPHATINSAGAPRVPNTTNIRFDGIDAEALVIALDLAGFAVSTGAACSSGAVSASHVLTAMGLDRAAAKSSIRFSLGRTNNNESVDALVNAVESAVERLRKLSTAFPIAPSHV
jgi:cysteine desulfurase